MWTSVTLPAVNTSRLPQPIFSSHHDTDGPYIGLYLTSGGYSIFHLGCAVTVQHYDKASNIVTVVGVGAPRNCEDVSSSQTAPTTSTIISPSPTTQIIPHSTILTTTPHSTILTNIPHSTFLTSSSLPSSTGNTSTAMSPSPSPTGTSPASITKAVVTSEVTCSHTLHHTPHCP